MSTTPRAAAAHTLSSILRDGRSLSDTLPEAQSKLDDPRDQALLSELCYGVLRWHLRLQTVVKELLKTPLRRKDQDVHSLLLLGLYQLAYLRTPPHAAIHATVQACRELDRPWAAKLVNGVLRNFQRRCDELLAKVDTDPTVRESHPRWLVQALRKDWPDQWQALLAANNAHAPMSLRVNRLRGHRDAYLSTLLAQGIDARAAPLAKDGILLTKPCNPESLPGFEQGLASVQDGAAQLAAPLLDPRPGERVLDACAAPGGKTCHLLELQPRVEELWAVDNGPRRLERLHANLQRLNLQAKVVEGDVADPTAWWDGRQFDRILLDAPCSATGVIRRHPDIKVLRRASDIPALAAAQRKILGALWPLLANDGFLLYATCSVLDEENDLLIRDFLASHADAEANLAAEPWGHRTPTGGIRFATGEQDMDGFYFARLRKLP